ncbi:hypothetical protein [Bradyrhizobium sp. AUGA SZCCT0283]|jgi:hypothetical protein|uniref:hypothetical protein n=1 Tax=Bradyrhizobium sp. AUGA SZCCT0283 TaxID=2807671 RepID=UPI001BAC5E37|nr:hypothetical protein [Bradyrhizobium sp. AUGA SZCCT0283]MBR1279612.1 hypothetical protein [Bradyrhizobium sp. AUGA SZCCT0283]
MKLVHNGWFRGRNWYWATILVLLVLPALPDNLAAQGLPVETGSHVSVALLFAGAVVLGLVLTYGITRNRSRTRSEKQITEQATKDLYVREERERANSGSE